MESIKGHPEHVETVFGEAIVARDESLVVLAGASGLGPPDLCWLQKAPKSALTGSSGEAKGYYHSCLGVDASSSAAVAAYFATLTSLVEAPTFLQGLFSTSEVRIERGFYCCYDPLSRLDVRCELCIPGGVVCGALDCEGNVHDVTPDLWRNCVVASFLRAELYDAELVSYSSVPVARYPPLPKPAEERRLLEAILGLYEDMVLPEALEALTVDHSGGVSPEHADVVLHTLLHYLAKRQKWSTALKYFSRLVKTYPTAALYVAAVQRECGLYDVALSTLSQAVEETPDDPVLLAGLAAECLYSDQVDAALRFITKAVRLRPQLRSAWLILARAYVRQGAGAAALVVLNLVPPPPLPGKEGAMLHVVVPPDPKYITKPALQPYDLDVVSVRQVLAEEACINSPSSSSSGAPDSNPSISTALPGAMLVPREPQDAGAAPDTAPLRVTKAVLAAVYTVLQELVAVSGWDGFLRLRSSVFVMHADSDILREQQREAEERERQLQLLHEQLSATLPPSPGWIAPPPALDAPPPEAENSRRVLPEGMDFSAALDEAAMMGLAEYPEHLEDAYDDPRVIAAREAHRRHLREIAERQARLEAAEGGAYADDEWDGSSGGSAGGGGGGGAGGRAGGGARSATGRSRRGRHRGRRTPGGRYCRRLQQLEQHLLGAEEVEDTEGASMEKETGLGRSKSMTPVNTATAGALAFLGHGIVDAGEVARQEAADAAESRAVDVEASLPQPLQPLQPDQHQQKDPVSVGSELEPSPQLVNTTSQTTPAMTSYWGTLFGVGVGVTPKGREAGPLGEAVEWLSIDRSRRPHGALDQADIVSATTHTSAVLAPPCEGYSRWRWCGQHKWCAGGPEAVCSALAATIAKLRLHRNASSSSSSSRTNVVGETVHGIAGIGLWWVPAAPAATATSMVKTCTRLAPPAPMRLEEQSRSVLCLHGSRHPDSICKAGGSLQPATEVEKMASQHSFSNIDALPGKVAAGTGFLRLLACKLRTQQSAGPGSGVVGGSAVSSQNGCQKYRPRWRWWRRFRRHSRRSLPLHLALPYRPNAPMLTSLCWSSINGIGQEVQEAGGGGHVASGANVAAEKSRGAALWQVSRCGPGPVAESGGDAVVFPRGGIDAAAAVAANSTAIDFRESPTTVKPSAFDKAALNASSGAADFSAAPDGGGGGIVAGGSGGDRGDDEGYPLLLHNQDADRQMVLQGLDVTELGAKRLCVRWLDELIVALWHDLQAFLDWKALDLELNESGFRTHAEIVAGVAPAPTAADYQRGVDAVALAAAGTSKDSPPALPSATPSRRPPPQLPSLPCMEWLRRGLLAERLHHEEDALAAYQAAVMTTPPSPGASGGAMGGNALFTALRGAGPGAFSMIAWQAIMRLGLNAESRDVTWALRAAQAVMTWLETRGVSLAATSAATAVPFTTGFVASLTSAAGGSGGEAGLAAFGPIQRAAPAVGTAASAAGSKLQACPLHVVYCLNIVAGFLGEVGVEATLHGMQPPKSVAGPGGTEAMPKKGDVSEPGVVATAKAGTTPPVHPAAAAVMRLAVQKGS